MTHFILTLLLFSILVCPNASQNTLQKKKSLKQVNKKIERLKSTISKEQAAKDKFQIELQRLEIAIGILYTELAAATSAHMDELNSLDLYSTKSSELLNNIKHDHNLLLNEYKYFYNIYSNTEKLSLSKITQPNNSKTSTYYSYIYHYRVQKILEQHKLYSSIVQRKAKASKQANYIESVMQSQQDIRIKLNDKLLERQKIIQDINLQLISDAEALTTLRNNKRSLSRLISKLEKKNRHKSSIENHITKWPNKLLKPIDGKIIHAFGDTIDNTGMLSNGMLYNAEPNQIVRAVADGKVIFANWLRGYGFLIILEHGDGYMSLYAHNNSLAKIVGEQIKSNEKIANAAQSGGIQNNSLYFELRMDGKPIDPRKLLS